MATAMCLGQSAARPKHQNNSAENVNEGCSTFLASLPKWVGHSQRLGYGQVRLPNGENDIITAPIHYHYVVSSSYVTMWCGPALIP